SAAVRPDAAGAPPRRHQNIRPPGLLPPTPAACRGHTADRASAVPPSAECHSASLAAPSAPARSGRNSPATDPLAVADQGPWIRPKPPAFATAHRGNARAPESAARSEEHTSELQSL